MRTILYSASTGYIARNLLRTGVIDTLMKDKDIRVVVVTPGSDDPDFVSEFRYPNRMFFEKMHEVSREYDLLDKVIWKSWLIAMKYRLMRPVYEFFVNLQVHLRYYGPYLKRYGPVFDKYKPDLVIGASMGIYSRRDIPVYAQARARGIKTLVLVHSWDNIARRKGPAWFRPDVLGVWNQSQKRDAEDVHFYEPGNVELVGPVHFDIYWQKDTFISRSEFFGKMGLSMDKKLITFIATCPGLVKNYYIVDILLEALAASKFVSPVQLVCRPTPSIDPARNEAEFGRYRERTDILIDSQARHASSLGWNPGRQQLYHFANLIKHTDVQVSIISTATIEAAILDRPAVNVAFSTIEPELFKKHIIDSVFKNHFKVVLDSKATSIAETPQDLISAINRYLADPDLHSPERRRLSMELVYKCDGHARARAEELILKLLTGR